MLIRLKIILPVVSLVSLIMLVSYFVLEGYGLFGLFFIAIFLLSSTIAIIATPVSLGLLLGIKKDLYKNTKANKIFRIFMSVIILNLAIVNIFFQRDLLVFGIRLRVAYTGGIEELQNWATSILEKPESELMVYFKENGMIRKEYISILSGQVRQLGVVELSKDNKGDRYFRIIMAGGFLSGWGIIVGEQSFNGDFNNKEYAIYWKDGVYIYLE